MDDRRLLLLDTASLYFRAFFGVPSSITAPDGRPVNAVRGLLDFISHFVRNYQPDQLACCWDEAWRPAWRVALVPSYKGHRVASGEIEVVPEGLQAQIPLIRELLAAAGLAVIGAPDHEADDVIGTLAHRATSAVDIATGDRDLFQLVDDAARIRVLYCGRGVAKHEIVDEAWVFGKYGVPAHRYVDFAVLRGDPSDGLPGVAGIGEKTAASLVGRFPDLEAMVAGIVAGEVPAAPGRRLAAALDYLAPAREVVRVATDAPVSAADLTLPATLSPEFDALAASLGLGGSADRLRAALAQAAGRTT